MRTIKFKDTLLNIDHIKEVTLTKDNKLFIDCGQTAYTIDFDFAGEAPNEFLKLVKAFNDHEITGKSIDINYYSGQS